MTENPKLYYLSSIFVYCTLYVFKERSYSIILKWISVSNGMAEMWISRLLFKIDWRWFSEHSVYNSFGLLVSVILQQTYFYIKVIFFSFLKMFSYIVSIISNRFATIERFLSCLCINHHQSLKNVLLHLWRKHFKLTRSTL